MNEILQLKGIFEQSSAKNKPAPPNIPKNKHIQLQHLYLLREDLENVLNFWEKEILKINPLITVYYNNIVAKSTRAKGILGGTQEKNNNLIVGSKFTKGIEKKHIITYCIDIKILKKTLTDITNAIELFKKYFTDIITYSDIEDINKNKYKHIFNNSLLKKSKFVNILVDMYHIESFGIEKDISNFNENAIVTIYDTGLKTEEIMKQLNINFLEVKSIDETTLLLNPEQFKILKDKAPYLISMAVSDISILDNEDFNFGTEKLITVPSPQNEPIIGVIDTMFDESVYFSEWVEFNNMLDKNIELRKEDYRHGTMVSSIIVDGPTLNPFLDDGCGRFKVKHFGVATSGRFSSFTILRTIKEIVEKNRDIKVWNLSLGSTMEVNENFISPEAAILDKIQYENDVIFVIAGTNKPKNSKIKRIGAPADSINSIVINSVGFDGKPAEYSREGNVLSFFNKPDVCYYGGDRNKAIRVCSPLGEAFVEGTSFAAPWIARKLAYLINILGLSRELAKALIIDSATGWNNIDYSAKLVGYGTVPIHINSIIKTPKDEIKFMLSGVSEKYETYNYNIPIPEEKEKQPFVSKATLCYFPNCSRNQGVDYTNTEMDIHFGRLKLNKKGNIEIDTINDNKQDNEGSIVLYEETARRLFRKWDNIKHIRENLKTPKGKMKKPKKKKEKGLWGIKIKTKERLNKKDGENVRFGVIITLKEVNGVNRIQEFIQQCQFRGWLVNKIDIENRIDIYNIAREEIELE